MEKQRPRDLGVEGISVVEQVMEEGAWGTARREADSPSDLRS